MGRHWKTPAEPGKILMPCGENEGVSNKMQTLFWKGIGKLLMDALENWFTHHAIVKFYSDTIPEEFPQSTAAHLHSGYKVLHNITIFLKE